LTPSLTTRFAALAAVPTWQWIRIASAVLTAAALAFLLANAYGPRRRGRALLAGGVLVLSLFSGGAAIAAIHTYGTASRDNAVIVARTGTLRSIPTEADTAQKTSPLPAGTLALTAQTFLGWTQIALANGQTGWVRKDDVIALWR
jgi:hypothetical protein